MYSNEKVKQKKCKPQNNQVSYLFGVNHANRHAEYKDDTAPNSRKRREVRQNDHTANPMFAFDYIIAYLSTFMTLKPGYTIPTGTPNGNGTRLDPPIYLKPGDVVEIEAVRLGVLRSGLVDEYTL